MTWLFQYFGNGFPRLILTMSGRVPRLVGQSCHGQKRVHRYYIHAASRGDVIDCPIKRIRADEIEEVVGQHITTVLKDGGYLDAISKRIVGMGKERQLEERATKTRLKKQIRDCEVEMESAFKLQVRANMGSEAEKFVLNKIENLGLRKMELEKSLKDIVASASNIISLDEVRQDLEDRVYKVNRGWAKLPDAQKRRVLRRLIQGLAVSANGLDISYYTCATETEGGRSEPSGKSASSLKVFAFNDQGKDSKSSVQNCTSASLAILA